jgi:predicted O-methyltransferase YrrM
MPSLIRQAKEAAKNSLHGIFALGQHFGVDILPRHFYSEIPDLRELRTDPSWKQPRSMRGIRGTDVNAQLAFARDTVTPPLVETLNRENIHQFACARNGAVGYGSTEAEFLYCFIATHRPGKIIQVGSGVSTAVILRAAQDVGYKPQVIAIEPYPTQFLKDAAKNGEIELIPRKCQQVELSVYDQLGPGDLLFVDSTHTVKPGSEVNLLIFDVLPKLQSGCLVHFHDIYFPYDYQSSLLETVTFHNESALLEALLTDSPRYAILCSLSMIHHANPQGLTNLFPHYHPGRFDHGLHAEHPHGQFPSATYIAVLEPPLNGASGPSAA